MSLFNFDFSQEITKERIEKVTKELALFFKENGNPRYMDLDGVKYRINEIGQVSSTTIMPPSIRTMLPYLKDEGYIELTENGRFSLKHEFRDYHTLDELIDKFRNLAYDYLNQGGDAYGLLSIKTTFGLYYHLGSKTENEKFSRALWDETSRIQRELGLKHWLENPKSRGHRMNIFSDGDLKKVKKRMAEELVEMTDYQSVKSYFKRHAAYAGLKEYNRNSPYINESEISILDISFLLPTDFCCQCIAEAEDVKTVMLIMDYMGRCNRPARDDEEFILINKDGVKKRYNSKRDLKKTFDELDELYDLDEIPSEENGSFESLFSSFDYEILDELFEKESEVEVP